MTASTLLRLSQCQRVRFLAGHLGQRAGLSPVNHCFFLASIKKAPTTFRMCTAVWLSTRDPRPPKRAAVHRARGHFYFAGEGDVSTLL